jgi:periplasmic divalent cation tolerance protein
MSTDALVVLSTLPDAVLAREIAGTLVDERLAACINIIPGLVSVYRWQGAIQQDDEVLMLMKTTQAGYARLEARLRGLHPYELPEIIAVPVGDGQADYLKWINDSIEPST